MVTQYPGVFGTLRISMSEFSWDIQYSMFRFLLRHWCLNPKCWLPLQVMVRRRRLWSRRQAPSTKTCQSRHSTQWRRSMEEGQGKWFG